MVKTLGRQCPGADLWQIPLPTSPAHCPRQGQSQLSGEEAVSEPATISLHRTASPLGILTINWVSETMPTFVLIKATELKTKQNKTKGSWLVKHERYQDKIRAPISLQFSAWCFGENVEGPAGGPAQGCHRGKPLTGDGSILL